MFFKGGDCTITKPLPISQLVGKFSHGRPSMEILRKAFAAIGFVGSFSLGLMDYRHVLICFTLEEDFHRRWLKGLWVIQEFPIRVFKWSPDFKLNAESSRAPVWISFVALSILFFDKAALFLIASAIGSPLKIDSATASLARLNVVRVRVDVDLCKDLPHINWCSGRWFLAEYCARRSSLLLHSLP